MDFLSVRIINSCIIIFLLFELLTGREYSVIIGKYFAFVFWAWACICSAKITNSHFFQRALF
jgi:hypothetical protein